MLNKAGKILLILSVVCLILTIAFSNSASITQNQPYWLLPFIFLFSEVCLSLSLSFIFLASIPAKRKKVAKVISITSGIIFVFGVLSKILYAPFAGVEIISSVFLFSFAGLPLIIKSRYESRKVIVSRTALLLSIVDLSAILLICLGALFRFMHWAGSPLILIPGIILFLISLVSWNLSFRKEVKLRMETEAELQRALKEVEEKQKEILDSIRYAKRIQQAHLPVESTIAKTINRLTKGK